MTPAEHAPDALGAARKHIAAAPGKRIRARLLTAAAVACGGPGAADRSRAAAEALELIHSYSLVHDDLPAMDDDDLRRGQPTVHVAFDEATAILLGDGLQAQAFGLLADDTALTAEQRVAAVSRLAHAAGFDGMVGGQSLDMQATNHELSLQDLQRMHALKTGALIRAALEIGGIVGGASATQSHTLSELGNCIGLAFQVVDDILDVASDSATLGKTQGKDAASNKATYVSTLGLEGARAEATRLRQQATALLADWDGDSTELLELVRLITERDR